MQNCKGSKYRKTKYLSVITTLSPSQSWSSDTCNSMIMILTLTTDQIRYHLVDLSPDKKDDGEKVEDDQGRDEDRRLRSIVPRPLPSPSLKRGYLIVGANEANGLKWSILIMVAKPSSRAGSWGNKGLRLACKERKSPKICKKLFMNVKVIYQRGKLFMHVKVIYECENIFMNVTI